ncbi:MULTISPECIES: InlB B-repeat-containing protein [Halolamina]|uniref:PKD domain-containing protein n=1 Tax=Halolamina pelagica TaxID=699431 RepID=A0A1I5ULT2_9EURY|nr:MULTISPECIES: hypothetical protein [Halolamina]NHX37597.1 hypothetical protein [Halolamina sp. R1-12]SFP96180.1 hypothetical protein SAMN05216277_11334 [Halolamina pelagica]
MGRPGSFGNIALPVVLSVLLVLAPMTAFVTPGSAAPATDTAPSLYVASDSDAVQDQSGGSDILGAVVDTVDAAASMQANEAPVIEDTDPEDTMRTESGVWSDEFYVDATDPDGDELTYTWNWWDGDELLGSWENDERNDFKWDQPGTYTIEVVVSDGQASTSYQWMFIIEEADTTDSFELDLNTDGEGIVEANPPGTIGDSFSETYESGDTVQLTADADANYEFTGWEGDVESHQRDDKSIEVTMDQAKDITATFEQADNEAPIIEWASPDHTVRTDVGEWSEYFEVQANDPDGDDSDLTYTWKWWDDDELLGSWEDDERNDFKWDEPGEYTIEVIVSDGEDTTSYSWEFIIESGTTTYELDVESDGGGDVDIDPPGRTDDAFQADYEEGTEIELTADADTGYEFAGWEGDLASDKRNERSIEVTMDRARDLTATFERAANEAPEIIDVSPRGTVTTAAGEWSEVFEVDVTDPDGDDSDLTYTWKWWDDDELVATFKDSGADNDFKWDEEGDYRIEVVVSDGEDSVSHSWEFIIEADTTTYDLEVDTDGSGDGEVALAPPGTTVENYESAFESGTVIELTARSGEESKFTGWDGDLASYKRDERSIEVTMDQARDLTATFEQATNQAPVIEAIDPEGTMRTELGVWSEPFEVHATDPDGDDSDLTYTWKWWDGDELIASWDDDATMDFKWDEEGEYRIQVVVSDGEHLTSHSWEFIIGTPGDNTGPPLEVATVDLNGDSFVAGQQATGSVTLETAGEQSREVALGVQAVGPNGDTYAVDLRDGPDVLVPGEGPTIVDVMLPVRDGYPTGEYDLRITVWPADSPQTAETRLLRTTREAAFDVVPPKSERAAVSIGDLDRDRYLFDETVDMTATVENTGNSERTFDVSLFLRRPDGTRLDVGEKRGVTITPGRDRELDFQHQFGDNGLAGEYDIVVEVSEAGDEITSMTDRKAFDLVGGDAADVTIDYVYLGGALVSPEDHVSPVIGVSTGELGRELVVEYTLRGPDGEIYTPRENTRSIELGEFGHEQLRPEIRITDQYPDGQYDLIVTVKASEDSSQVLARQVKESGIEVDGNSDASISLAPQGEFSAEVTLFRDGDRIGLDYITDGDSITFDGLAAGSYTVEYAMYFPGGKDTVRRSIQLSDGQARVLELDPEKASASGFVEIDGTRLNYGTVVISGEPADTDSNGNFQTGPSLSPGYHTLLVKYDGRTIYREGVEIEPGQNRIDVTIDYVDPHPDDEFDGEELMLGFWCGELCYASGDSGHTNAEYMLGWMLGAVNPAFDVRDGLASAGKGDAVGVGLSIIGLAPYAGDISSIGGRLARVIPDLPSSQAFRLKEMVRKSSINKKDELLDYLNQHTSAKNTLKESFGLSGDFTKRLSDSRARKLRFAAGRMKAAGYDSEDVARFIRRNGESGNLQKVDEFSHAVYQYEKATDTVPKTHGEMLEAIWFNRVRKAEGADIARKTTQGGQLTAGKTYVATGVELRAGGELDVVVFTVDEAGNPTVTKAYEVTRGSVSNKPTNQLVRNLGRGADAGSDSHHYLDSDAFARQATAQQDGGYVGFADDVDINIADSRTPTAGAQLYDDAEFARMSDDLGLVKDDP